MNTNELITKSKEIFPNKNWSYDETVYINPNTKIKIYCHEKDGFGNEHGYFEQLPFSHLSGHGCKKCSRRSEKYTLDEWLLSANKSNDNKFEYIIDEYNNQHQRVKCICHKKDKNGEEHGVFERTCKQVISGTYCPKCRKEERIINKQNDIINKCIEIHDNKYDYSKLIYKTQNDNVEVICHKKDKNGNEHGSFYPKLYNHIYNKSGCPKCAIENSIQNKKITYDDVIQRSKELYGDRYDLSLIDPNEIDGVETKIKIVCKEHGVFEKSIHSFLSGCGCQKCAIESAKEKTRLGNDVWLERFNKVHNNFYSYNLTNNISYADKIEIICPIHGSFIQKVGSHANGQGCPKCRQSHLEKIVMSCFDKNGLNYEYQKRFDWLGKQSLDFYLPNLNIGIECQGSQHFEKDKFFKDISITIERDERKRMLCEENGLRLIYFLDKKYNKYVEKLNIPYFNNLDDLIKFIKNG